MTDLNLRINGDASGAVSAFNDAGGAAEGLGEDVGKSVVKWQELANVAKAAAEMVVRFGVDAVKAYAESERVQRQLARAAGDYADVLDDQAEALSRLYAVDDDIIKQSEILLTQWGGVGAATKEVEEAILNYAAATGQDAVGATQDLIRNVESGGVGLAKLGVHFTATGDKGKDLAAAVAALNAKFGGAATADAESLTGSLRGAGLAFDDLQKSIGESIAGFMQETGAVGALTSALREMDEFITQKRARGELDEKLRALDLANAKTELANAQYELNEAMMEGQSDTIIQMFSEDVDRAQAKLDALVGSSKDLALPGIGSVTGTTNKAQHEAAAEDAKKGLELTKHYVQEETAAVRDGMAEQSVLIQQQNEEAAAADKEMRAQALADQQKYYDAQEKAALESHKQRSALEREALAATLKAEEERLHAAEDALRKQEQAWHNAGDQIGAAFVNALSDQLASLASGGEFDAAVFVGEILAATISIAATAIGSAYGQPALGAAIGNLAAMGVRAGAGAISAESRSKGIGAKKYHTGGVVQGGLVDDWPRLSSGGLLPDERPIIAQTGEVVASRNDVARAGGPQAMKEMLRTGGRPGVVVNVTALDALSAARSFVGEVGEGLKQAVRSGHGAVPALLGVSPR